MSSRFAAVVTPWLGSSWRCAFLCRFAQLELAERRAGRLVAKPANMLTILFILLLVALIGGGLGHGRFGYAGWSPAGILIVVLLVLFLTGNRL